ncbi:MAG: DUF3035 domain-containing protein [Pseudomonadota bacterium]
MTPAYLLRGSLLGLAIIALAGCQAIREDLGVEKTSPDEFRVVANAPLAIPPDYNLRPPAPGASRPQAATPTEQARVAVFGPQGRIEPGEAQPGSPAASADNSFLAAAGANQTDANIRQVVDDETQRINAQNQDFVDSLIFWRAPAAPGTVVDATSEADRIRETQALGQPVTTGDTPIVITREQGILEGIF